MVHLGWLFAQGIFFRFSWCITFLSSNRKNSSCFRDQNLEIRLLLRLNVDMGQGFIDNTDQQPKQRSQHMPKPTKDYSVFIVF